MGLFSKLFSKTKKKDSDENTTSEEIKVENLPEEKENTVVVAKVENSSEKNESTTEVAEVENDSVDPAAFEESVPVASKELTGFFEIKKSKDDRYVFNLYASNRVIIATSQVYSSSKSALNGANSVIANAAKANVEDQTLKNYTPMPYPKWEIYKDKGEQFRFRLSASNGSCICHSQGYTSKASCKNGIESIIRTVKNADIQKAYIANKNQTK